MRLVDADKLKAHSFVLKPFEYRQRAMMVIETSYIDHLQTEDFVKHGRWIKISEGVWKCSNCGNWWSFDDSLHIDGCYKYCPDCGAKMDW